MAMRLMTEEREREARASLIAAERRAAAGYRRLMERLAEQGIAEAIAMEPLAAGLDACNRRLRELGADPNLNA